MVTIIDVVIGTKDVVKDLSIFIHDHKNINHYDTIDKYLDSIKGDKKCKD